MVEDMEQGQQWKSIEVCPGPGHLDELAVSGPM